MSIRILGGSAKGVELDVPKGDRIRPTSVMLRRKLFDSFQADLPEFFVDLFAGSGSVGLEALSRGVPKVYLSEKDSKVYSILSKNAGKFKGDIKTFKTPFEKFLPRFISEYQLLSEEIQKNTVLFYDPPYALHKKLESFLDNQIFNGDWFKGSLWLESDDKKGLSLDVWRGKTPSPMKVFHHSDSFVCIFKF